MDMEVQAGVWQHWKHPQRPRQYLVLGLAHDANEDGREVVVYVPLYVDPASPFGGYKESGYGREGGRHGLAAYLAAETFGSASTAKGLGK